MPSLRIAVIGAGIMGMNHLRMLHEFSRDQVEIVGVAEIRADIRQQAMERFHIPGYASYQSMITHEKPDLVAVIAPTQMHHRMAAFALEHDAHVLVEKPIASTLEEAEELITLAHARGKFLAVGHVERYNPAVTALKQQIQAGTIGKIYSLSARRLGPFPPRIRDVGVILDLATHDVDIMHYLADSPVERVYAETQRRVHQQCEDLLLGVISFRNEVVGLLDINWLTPTKVRELSVTGEHGMYIVNYLTQDLYFYENDYTDTNWDTIRSIAGVSEGTMTRLKVQKAEPLRLEYEDIIQAVQQHREPRVTGEDGFAALRTAHLLMEAARTRSVITTLARMPV